MNNFIKKYFKNDKIRYLFAGGCTTAVNLISFFLLRSLTNIERNTCNVIAIIMAITFAYFINKYFVFRVKTKTVGAVIAEAVSFIALRIVSMAVEIIGFAILCDSFRINELLSKIAVQFVVVVLNYVFSKLFIFKKERMSFKERFVDNYCYFISFGIVFVVMLVIMIVEKIAPFGQHSLTLVDSLHQYIPFFAEYRDKLLNEGSLFYTWNVAMGSNFISLSAYYLSSPFNLLFLLFKKEHIVAVFCIIEIAKISLSAVTMTHFLSWKDGKKSRSIHIIAIAVAYALSNYVVGYYWNIMWMDCILIFPLIILGFSRLMEDKDPKLYTLSLFYALYCNYYIGFIICMFLVIWFLVYNHKRIKKFFMDGLRFALFSLISGGMAAFLLIPAYKGIMMTSSADAKLPKWEWYGNIFALLKQHLLMTLSITNQVFDGGVNLYCSMLAVFSFFLYLFANKIKLLDKIRYVAVLAFLMVSFNSVTLNFIWHGFHDQYGIPNRFSFLYIFVILVMAYDVLKKSKYMRAIQVVIAGLLSTAFILSCEKYGEISVKIMAASFIAVIIYLAVCLLRSFGVYKSRLFHVLITGFCLIEVCTNAILGFLDNGYSQYMNYYETTPAVTAANKRIDELGAQQHAGFYRRELMDSTVLDEATWHNMPSIGIFCSTVLGEMTTLMGKLGFYTGANEFLYMGSTPFTNSIFNVRYLLEREGDLNNFAFDYVEDVDGVGIYENPYPLSLGFAVSKDIKDWDRAAALPLKNQNAMATAMTNVDGMFYSVYPELTVSSDDCDVTVSGSVINYESYESGKASIMASFTAEVDGDYYVNCRGNYVTKVRFYINGNEIAYDRYQIQIFHLGELKEGDYVSVEYCYDNMKLGSEVASMYIALFNENSYQRVYDVLDDNLMLLDEFDDGYVKGTIDMPANKVLFTSVPYDKGWTVFVDGEKVEYYAIGEALIGFDVPEGVHAIEMKYVPVGLYLGIGISVVCWLLLLGFVIAGTNKKEEKND